MRLIDADELIHLYFDDENGKPVFDFVPWEFVENAPTIEAEPVKHGRWEHYKTELLFDDIMGGEYSFERFRCSVCHFDVGGNNEYPFCPNCGAKMDLDEVEECQQIQK